MTELEKAAEAREIDICQYSTNNCLNTNDCHRCQWGVPSLDLRCSNNASFKLGAQWQARQSPWISAKNQLPKDQQIVLVRSEYGGICTAYLHGKNSGFITYGEDAYKVFGEITHWMFIPSFDEILEDNKDVLKRIKENGCK